MCVSAAVEKDMVTLKSLVDDQTIARHLTARPDRDVVQTACVRTR